MGKVKNIRVVAPILLVIFSIIYYFFFFKSDEPKIIHVKITEDGFYPDRVNINPGDTVVWTNQGEKLHWPASNFHPDHTFYPEPGGCLGSNFDACRGLKKGEVYEFRFNIVGNWPVHDHLFPGLIMTVEVSSNKRLSKSSLYNPKTSVEDFRKYDYSRQIDFIKMMSDDNPQKAWEYLKDAFIINNQVVGNAHEFAHIIGNESYKKSGLEGIKICDKAFAFGCFHGVTESMLLNEGITKIKDIEEGCLKIFPPTLNNDYASCIHGTGHGIFTWESGDLNRSLLDCDVISPTYRQYCYDGVFMENTSLPQSKIISSGNLWKLCSDLDERYHYNCARYQSQIFLSQTSGPNPVKDVGLNCEKGASTTLKETCFLSLGFYVAQNAIGVESKILEACRSMPNKTGIEICTMGGAIETVFQKYGNYSVASIDLCQNISEPKKSECLTSVKLMLN